ncbi:Protein of unknown function (DUF322) [Halobacteroides halobius DSM 5150]|uniref:Alkaline shock protein 23 n=1 Tax=Halobacteroides halobius (strain ATCC 35273 / DSM 5150 / MD-1) TaxID=748449 RepID=L0K8S1_HALHC|nr:alkaline shock response membrane anchor protein AmaP [Halobacteroides halobius]AGB40518.1 Protein of unknown function (DUF322) [Halobacteroides halobius DSM 5150]
MQYLDRFFVLVFTLLWTIVSLLMMGISIGWIDSLYLVDLINQDLQLVGIIGGILFLISLRILQLFLPGKEKVTQTVVAQGKLGTIKVSLGAIKKLAEEIVRQEVKVTEIKSKVEVTEQGVDILLDLAIVSRANIAELGEKLQEQIREQVTASTGAEVDQVEILINKVSRQEKPNKGLD